jgi:hypothetical protein
MRMNIYVVIIYQWKVFTGNTFGDIVRTKTLLPPAPTDQVQE